MIRTGNTSSNQIDHPGSTFIMDLWIIRDGEGFIVFQCFSIVFRWFKLQESPLPPKSDVRTQQMAACLHRNWPNQLCLESVASCQDCKQVMFCGKARSSSPGLSVLPTEWCWRFYKSQKSVSSSLELAEKHICMTCLETCWIILDWITCL